MIKRLTDEPLTLAQVRPEGRFPAELQRVMDRVLARTPADRYASAAEFGKDVRTVAQSSTGLVDVEAGTQVVKAEDLKKMLPATRVDPAAGRRTPAAPSPEPTARTAIAKPRSGFPVVPVAAGVVLLAIGGGAIALRGTLFGSANPDSVQTPVNKPPDSTADTTRMSGATTNPGTTTKPDSTQGGRTGTTPPRANAGRDSARPPARDSAKPPLINYPDAAELERQLNVYYDDFEFVDDPGKRVAAKQLAEQVFGTNSLAAKLRGKAAFVLYSAFLKENSNTVAKEWLDKAIQLDPSNTSYRTQLRVFN
jgi:hypothetical protein